MARFLAKVLDNADPDNQKRIKASIPGLTDDLEAGDLPWAFPVDPFCLVPPIEEDEKPSRVWITVEQKEDGEPLDFNDQRYSLYTEETYKEAYDYQNSDTFTVKDDNLLQDGDVQEPDIQGDPEYPDNRVIKLSGFTIEFDATNKRLSITSDEKGHYFDIREEEVIIKSNGELYLISKGNINIYHEGEFLYADGEGNKINMNSDGIKLECKNGNVVEMKTGKVLINDNFEVAQ